MPSVISDIKNAFRKNDNQIIQLMLIFLFVFLIHWLLQVSFGFTDNKAKYSEYLNKNYLLGTNFIEWLRQPWTLIIFPFTSSTFIDVLFNALALFWFGNLLSDFLGSKKVLLLFVMGAIFSGITYVSFVHIYNIFKPLRVSPYIFGSSAGVYTVLFAAVALLPDYELMFFRFFIKLRYIAVAFLIFSMVMNLQTGIMHFSASIFGYSYIKLLQNGINLSEPIDKIIRLLSGKRRKKEKPVVFKSFSKTSVGGEYRKTSFFENSSFPDQEEIDYLLDKINKAGSYDALTKEEKMRLHQASQKKD
jgi:membrane associated rhomboid family serine protease